ncbi:uncharacterized protein LOC116007318 [Ipomoea triloba]|uniref:uncharacterized protein LOC116007318 n=1 Tax=Ipomoea triloba TaxID=35885 RepID=UPI00125CFD15|nr:uncharacterized protein LOC116007318 [Ipomoea triloba]
MLAQSPISAGQIQRLKAGRKPLQPKNAPATPLAADAIKPKLKPDWIEISLTNTSNKENVHPLHAPPQGAAKSKPSCNIELCDSSLAEELSAIRERLERLRIDKQKTEEMLRERDAAMELQMRELMKRGEMQKQFELEVDRLFRLKELRVSCMRISPIQSLRDKEREKKGKEDQSKETAETEDEGLECGIPPSSPNSDLDTEE